MEHRCRHLKEVTLRGRKVEEEAADLFGPHRVFIRADAKSLHVAIFLIVIISVNFFKSLKNIRHVDPIIAAIWSGSG